MNILCELTLIFEWLSIVGVMGDLIMNDIADFEKSAKLLYEEQIKFDDLASKVQTLVVDNFTLENLICSCRAEKDLWIEKIQKEAPNRNSKNIKKYYKLINFCERKIAKLNGQERELLRYGESLREQLMAINNAMNFGLDLGFASAEECISAIKMKFVEIYRKNKLIDFASQQYNLAQIAQKYFDVSTRLKKIEDNVQILNKQFFDNKKIYDKFSQAKNLNSQRIKESKNQHRISKFERQNKKYDEILKKQGKTFADIAFKAMALIRQLMDANSQFGFWNGDVEDFEKFRKDQLCERELTEQKKSISIQFCSAIIERLDKYFDKTKSNFCGALKNVPNNENKKSLTC